jgi:glycosyltransferase involved in cell wall biosynthesis
MAWTVLALLHQKIEVAMMKAVTLLLHDERFSGWTIMDKLSRQHFSLAYLRFFRQQGLESLLYTFHKQTRSKQMHRLKDVGTVKIFPVEFRFPPFLRFGNDHNPRSLMRELICDRPDVVHFHNYYLASFPYMATFVKKRLRRPLIAQLHGYDNGSLKRWLYLPCLLALRYVDRILYSYEPERKIYRRLGIEERTTKLPIPGIDPVVFRPERIHAENRLLYVGRIPAPEAAYGEKSPFLLIRILKKLLRRSNEVTLDIVGDGPGLFRCRELVKSLGISRHVVFYGYVPNHELPKYYYASTLTLSPIQVYDVDGWFDGAIQESLACGTPVAAFKASRYTSLRGTYGFLLSNDVEKAADELHGLLRRAEDFDEVSAEGSRFVRENCSCERVVSELGKALEGVMYN